ncbi:MAG: outer membrane protein assembly factor BamD [Candidatus Omnitrophota bacterium]|nr:outer membrane protein assembly factor BamD [Candidatus Omnitrophota bacterium]
MKRISIASIFILCIFILVQPVSAYWIWTPESGKWENPKQAAKDKPEDQLAYAKNFYEAKDIKDALREFKKLLKYYPLSKEAPSAQYYVGRIMEELDNTYEAFKAYQKVIDTYPYTDMVDDVIEREYKIADAFFSGKKIKIIGKWQMPAKDKAIEIFKAVADNAPYGKYADLAKFKAGLAYKDIQDYNSAILMFKDLIDRYPNSSVLDKARFQLAECSKLLSVKPAYDQTPTNLARKEFEDFLKKHPDSELAGDAKQVVDKLKSREAENEFETAKFYESRKLPASAIIYYKDIVQNYSDTDWAKKAQERLDELEKR